MAATTSGVGLIKRAAVLWNVSRLRFETMCWVNYHWRKSCKRSGHHLISLAKSQRADVRSRRSVGTDRCCMHESIGTCTYVQYKISLQIEATHDLPSEDWVPRTHVVGTQLRQQYWAYSWFIEGTSSGCWQEAGRVGSVGTREGSENSQVCRHLPTIDPFLDPR